MDFLFRHRWPLIAFAALTLLIEAPLIALPFYAGEAYQGINIAPIGNDELYYLSRAKAVLEGRSPGQAFMAGVGDVPDSFFSDVEYMYMVPLRVFGLAPYIDVPTLYNILNTIGVFVMLFLMYFLVRVFAKDPWIATAAAVFSIGGAFWVQYGTVLNLILSGKPIFAPIFNIFARSTDPYTALVPFFGFLICAYLALMQEEAPSFRNLRSLRYVLPAGALFGVLFYDYFYAWTFTFAVLGALGITSILRRRWNALYRIVSIGGLGILIGAPQLFALYQFYMSDIGQQISFFLLTEHRRVFIQSTTGIATLALFALYAYLRPDDKNNFFILALILAGWVALEQQLITGRMVQYGHYYWYFVVPISILVSVYMAMIMLKRWSFLAARFACAGFIAAGLVSTAGNQYLAFIQNAPDQIRQQDFAPIMKKMNELPDAAVLGDPGGPSSSLLLTVYTRHMNYFSYAGIVNVFPIERMREALLVYLYLNEESRLDPVAYLQKELTAAHATNYTDMYQTLEGYYNDIPLQDYRKTREDERMLVARATFLPEIGNEYHALTSLPQGVRSSLLAEGVAYVLWDQRQYPEWDLSVLEPLTVLATSTDIILYEISTTQ